MFKSTVYTVLGMLAIESMNGYEIKKSINESIQYFWNESPGQIYPALKVALEANLIDVKEDNGARNKITYAITDLGRETLKEWLGHSPEKFTQRNELLLKVFFGNETDQETIVHYLQESLHRMQKKLRQYHHIEETLKGYLNDKVDGAKYWCVISRYGIKALEASIEWAKESIIFIEDN